MRKLACGVALCYNQRRILLCLESAGTLPRLANLCRRLAMDMIPQDSMPRKQCTGPCGQTLSADREHFYADKRAKDGLQSACKKCQVEDKKVYAATHKETLKLYKSKYRSEHREQHKLYLQEHSEEIS